MSAKELMVNGKPLSSLRVVDLKEELEGRGLSKSGSKKDLADRLRMNVLLENQRSCQGSADEEQLPNISTREQLAEQNPFIRDYFQSQAELYHSQKVVKKLYEGMSQTPEEGEEPHAPAPKENEESSGEQSSPSPSPPEKSKVPPKSPPEAVTEKSKDVSDATSSSNHVEQPVKEKLEESNGSAESKSNLKAKKQALEVNKTAVASVIEDDESESESTSKAEEVAVQLKSSPVKESTAPSCPPQGGPVKEPEPEDTPKHVKKADIVQKPIEEPEAVKTPVEVPGAVEAHVDVDKPKTVETPVKKPEVVEKLVIKPDVVEKPLKATEIVEKNIKDPEVVDKPVKEPEPVLVEKPVQESEDIQKSVKKVEIVQKSVVKESENVLKSVVKEPVEIVQKSTVKEPQEVVQESTATVKEPEEVVQKSIVEETEIVEKKHIVVSEDVDKPVSSSVAVPVNKHKKDEKIEKVDDNSENKEVEKSRKRLEKRSITPEKVLAESKERKKRRARSPEKSSPDKDKEETVGEKSAKFSPIRVRNDHKDEDLDYGDEESDEKNKPDESTWKRRNLRIKGKSFTPEKVKVEKPKSPISLKSQENISTHKPSPLSSKSSRFSPAIENPAVDKTLKPFPIRSDQVDVDEALDYGYEEADSKRDHEGIAWSRRILRLKNRCSVIEKTEKKWNRIDRKPVVVTSSVLETFFPDVKLLPESEVKLEERIPKEPEIETERVKTERELVTNKFLEPSSLESNLPNIKRKISIIPFEETVKELTPPRNQPSKILVITNLTRPFTLMQLKELLQRTGTIEDIWVDKIKSKCLAKFDKEAEAEETRAALHGIKWPSSNPKALFVDFSAESEFEDIRTKEAGEKKLKIEKPEEAKVMPVREWDLGKRSRSRSPGRTKRPGSGDRDRKRSRKSASPHSRRSPHHDKKSRDHDIKEEAQAKALDELFRKTTTTPCLYWLPLTPQQISEKEELRRKRMVERERRLAEMEKLRPR